MCYCCKVNIIMVGDTSTHIMEAMRPCSCCLVRAPVKNLTTPHIHLGKTEIYSAMLIECLNIHLDLSTKECGICETCVSRLRDASDFKQQVQRCQVELRTLHNEELISDGMANTTAIKTSDNLPEIQHIKVITDKAAEEIPETVGKILEYTPYDQTEAVNLTKNKLLEYAPYDQTEAVNLTKNNLLEHETGAKTETDCAEASVHSQEHKCTGMKTEPIDGTSGHSSDEDDLIVLSDLVDKNGIHYNSYDMESIAEKLEEEGYEIDDCKPLLVTIGAVSIPSLQLHPGAREQLSTTCSVPLARGDVTRLAHPCLTCRLTFLTEASRDVHTRHCGTPNNLNTSSICENRVKIPCPVCYRSFLSNKRLKRHVKKVHLVENGTYACDTCGKEFTNKLILIKHINNHMTQKLYYCDVCSIGCFGKKLLKQHKMIHAFNRRYICEICNKQFNEKYKLHAHKRTHHIGVEQPFVCEICEGRFPDAITLKKHKLSHSSLKPFACKICYKQYSRLYALQKHQLIHHNISNRDSFNCQECHIQFSQMNDLILHKQKTHADQCNACVICQKQFLRKYDLDLHMARHTRQQQISCEVCSKKFLHRKYLVRHQRIHSGEKPYTCDMCLKQFAQRGSIVRHIKKHMGLKKHKCKVCSKMFIDSRALSRHKRKKHKKRKSHCCEICETNFSKKSYLVRHLQTHYES